MIDFARTSESLWCEKKITTVTAGIYVLTFGWRLAVKRFSRWIEIWKMRKWMQLLAKHEWRNFMCFSRIFWIIARVIFDCELSRPMHSCKFLTASYEISNFNLLTFLWQHVKKIFQFHRRFCLKLFEERRRVKGGWVLFQGEECRKIYLQALS